MSRLGDKWRRLRNLSNTERRLLFQALVLLPVTALGLRFLGFRRYQAALMRFPPGKRQAGSQEGGAIEQALLAARMIEAASREGLRRGNCLEKSLALWWLLRREGISSELRIGARKTPSALEAHAWVERDGVVLNEHDDLHRHYTPFDKSLAAAQVEPE